MKRLVLIFAIIGFGVSFECYSCNSEKRRTGPCIDRKTICENSTSCSMAVTFQNGKSVVRKFCTPPNTPIYQYLMMMPGASMCQNFELADSTQRQRRQTIGPPAYPGEQASLLCVCTTPLCNKGTYAKVLENTMLNNLPRRLLPSIQDFEKELKEEQNDFDANMQQQMADAGF
ncbi:unnamed protein product [Caenorhabditis bovis]|uniref:UPAR/Ly6 domain-containing protein n=1 Tax=Caenorhabditis bovis TaxID=2654633 RepID=A0A8S1E6H8_9PELO|nr:unnamed protein product [Caenorhabditis bovis]